MTPDWAARATAVPYAVFGDPQSLNLYGYVRNDPVSQVDPDGHEGLPPAASSQPQVPRDNATPLACYNTPNNCTVAEQAQSNGVDGKTIGKGVGEVGVGGGLITLTILLAPETGGGPKAWAIFLCRGFVVFVCVLKLRNLIHGVGWVFPRSGTTMLCVLAAEVWLHLWFSH